MISRNSKLRFQQGGLYSVGLGVYMLPSNTNLNKILVSDGTFSLGNNDKVNTLELAKVNKPTVSHKTVAELTITYKNLF